ncbi:MAG: hypothetical protein M1814_005099, partial [Vezdaea aestivalis]
MALQNNTKYALVDIPRFGRGMIATAKIALGELIVSEPPLFKFPSNSSGMGGKSITEYLTKIVQALSKDDQHAYFGLANSYSSLGPIQGIMKTNAMPLGTRAAFGGIFVVCSRFNHSCRNNAEYSWSSKHGEERVYAVKEIKEGEQICVSYLGDQMRMSATDNRKTYLSESFGFDCVCQLYGASNKVRKASDRRRSKIGAMDRIVGDVIEDLDYSPQILGLCREILELLEAESEMGMTLVRHLGDAVEICSMNNDMARASSFASLSAKQRALAQGEDGHDSEKDQLDTRDSGNESMAGTGALLLLLLLLLVLKTK